MLIRSMPESYTSWIDWLAAARYVFAAFLVISLPPAVCWWFLVHPLARRLRRLGAKVALTLVFALFFLSIAALFPFRDALLAEDLGFRPLLAACGVPLLAVSGWVARQRKKHLTWRILLGIPEMSADPADSKLLDQGIYSRVRHPRYVEFTLGMIGWALILNYLGLYWMTAAGIAAVLLIVPLEERELRDRFGTAYDDYARRVPRYLPHRRA